ncbi:MAG: hypothetical protein M3R36_00110 [Bacteroidota bacterium]|nr:hypothetical protein [Bacteroidota bacterium]
MKVESLNYIKYDLKSLDQMINSLDIAFNICKNIGEKNSYTEEEFMYFDVLTSRFSRLSDYIIQKAIRTIDKIDEEDAGTVRDRLNRAEKKELISSTDEFVEIRNLRNDITHEYIPEEMSEIFNGVMRYTPILKDSVERIKKYCKEKYKV